MELVDQVSRMTTIRRQTVNVVICCSCAESVTRLQSILRKAAGVNGWELVVDTHPSHWGLRVHLEEAYSDLVLVSETDLPAESRGNLLLASQDEAQFGFLPLHEGHQSASSSSVLRCLNLNDPPEILETAVTALLHTALQHRSRAIRYQTQSLLLALHRIYFTGQPLKEILAVALSELNRICYVDREAQSAIFLLYPGARALKVAAALNIDDETVPAIEAVLNLALISEDNSGEQLLFRRPEQVGDNCCLIPLLDNDRLLGVVMFHSNHPFDITDLSLAVTDEIANGVCSLVNDHRERSRVDRVYQQNNQLIQSISSAIVGVDIYDCVSHWNRSAEHYLGLTADEVKGRSIMSLPLEWSWAHISLKVLTCLTEKVSTERFEAPYTNAAGEAGVFSIVITPLLDERGNFGGYLMLLDDITAKADEEKKAQQAERLQAIGQLAAGIAHEINTPIQYVGDNLHFLRDAFTDVAQVTRQCSDWVLRQQQIAELAGLQTMINELDLDYLMEEVPQAVQQALDGVDHVSRIVRAMKDFSHPGSDEKVDTDINRTIQTTVTITRNIWKHIAELRLELDEQLPLIKTFPGPLSEVLLNLIVNACDAIQEAIEGEGAKGLLRIRSQVGEGWLEISVADSGCGIPEEVQPYIFDQFFTTKPVGKGTGQGLSLSHKVIEEQHGGSLTFTSEPGHGSCFIIRLPMEEGAGNDSKKAATYPVSG